MRWALFGESKNSIIFYNKYNTFVQTAQCIITVTGIMYNSYCILAGSDIYIILVN